MENGPTVILTTAPTTTSTDKSVSTSMTMGTSTSTILPQKPIVKSLASSPCDMALKSNWPAFVSSIARNQSNHSNYHHQYLQDYHYPHSSNHVHYLNHRLHQLLPPSDQMSLKSVELCHSRHSTSDVQLRGTRDGDHCEKSETGNSPVPEGYTDARLKMHSRNLEKNTNWSYCRDQPNLRKYDRVTLSIPCDLSVSGQCPHSQGRQQPRSCPESQTFLQMKQPNIHSQSQYLSSPSAVAADWEEQFGRIPIVQSDKMIDLLTNGSASFKVLTNHSNIANSVCQIGYPTAPQKLHPTITSNVSEPDKPAGMKITSNRSTNFRIFKMKRVHSGPKTSRCLPESAVAIVHQRSNSTNAVTPWDDQTITFDNQHMARKSVLLHQPHQYEPQQQYATFRQSTAGWPLDQNAENDEVVVEDPLSSNRSSATVPEVHILRSSKSLTLGHTGTLSTDNRDLLGQHGTGTVILNRRSLIFNNSSPFTTDPRSKTCCFCWCCCCSCSCMRVRANIHESKRPSASNDPHCRLEEMSADEKLTYDEVKSWGDSFDLLMQSSGGRKVFREFLRLEYSEENILFWLACEELKQETNPELVEEKARMIYEDFISILSPREVSLDSRVRELINTNMIEPTPRTFDEAQLQIYTLMHRDSYLRFLNSRIYKDLLQQTSNTLSNESLS